MPIRPEGVYGLATLGTMAPRTDSFELGRLRLAPGEARRASLHVAVEPFTFSGERYAASPGVVPVALSVSRMSGGGYSLRLRFAVAVEGPCMRCLEEAAPPVEVDAREVDRPGGGDQLESPYVGDGSLDLRGWARDALMLALPPQLICRPDCAGLCPVCGENLNRAAPGHAHEREPDPRWAKLRELRLE